MATVRYGEITLEMAAGKDPLDPRQGEVPVHPYTDSLDLGVEGLWIGVLSEAVGLEVSESEEEETVTSSLQPDWCSGNRDQHARKWRGGRNLLGFGHGGSRCSSA